MNAMTRLTLTLTLLAYGQAWSGPVHAQASSHTDLPIPGPYQLVPGGSGEGGTFAPPPGGLGVPYWMMQDEVSPATIPAAPGGGVAATRQTLPSYAPLQALSPQASQHPGQAILPGFYPGYAPAYGQVAPPQYAPAPQQQPAQRTASAPVQQPYGYFGYPQPYGYQLPPGYGVRQPATGAWPQGWGWPAYPGWGAVPPGVKGVGK
jgi:hypothetical protein